MAGFILKNTLSENGAVTRGICETNAEYLLPIYIDELLQAGKVSVKVLDSHDKWFGVTYKEDKDYVVESFGKLIDAGVYAEDLFSDLKK